MRSGFCRKGQFKACATRICSHLFAAVFCVSRYDGTCTSNILLDTEDGRCCYRILLNRQERFCPFPLLLRCVGGALSLQQLKAKVLEDVFADKEECVALHSLLEQVWGSEAEFADTDVTEHRVSF